MPDYRRVWVPGGTFFFTVNLLERRNRRLLVEHIDHLRAAFSDAQRVRPFHVIAIVVLPEHLHCLWRLPEGDADNVDVARASNPDFPVDCQKPSIVPMSVSRSGNAASGNVGSGNT